MNHLLEKEFTKLPMSASNKKWVQAFFPLLKNELNSSRLATWESGSCLCRNDTIVKVNSHTVRGATVIKTELNKHN